MGLKKEERESHKEKIGVPASDFRCGNFSIQGNGDIRVLFGGYSLRKLFSHIVYNLVD